ncbi:hypothetical protein NQ314_014229 [Rhamnusium bicolor]|uniref:Uncharacterized protein n=1 Tax=Rhamnusium bicolor TaxID=1586634 RepID=A0AAV8X3I4_9CUCU|nr:hypothetical protein NQ314_014229 [Rhamnusium bicolor]
MNIARTSCIDANLFGSDFGERLKAAKDVEKSSRDLKANNASQSRFTKSNVDRKIQSNNKLNYRGPPRGKETRGITGHLATGNHRITINY